MADPILIGIAGGSGSGKTYLARYIQRKAGKAQVARLSMDQYFMTPAGDGSIDVRDINFDHPRHIELARFARDLEALKSGQAIEAPLYDFRQQRQLEETHHIEPRPVVVVDGLFLLAWPLVALFDLTVFLHVDPDQRLIGRLLRDMHEREGSVQWNIDRYQRFVRPSYETFIRPTMQNADLIVDFTYRRVFFQEMLAHIVRSYLHDGFGLEELVASVRGDDWQPGVGSGRRQDYQRLVNLEELMAKTPVPAPPGGPSPVVWAADNPEALSEELQNGTP
ncbi:MAG: Uridine kinase [bacterium]|nr:Uridine kinase [bacterium]